MTEEKRAVHNAQVYPVLISVARWQSGVRRLSGGLRRVVKG